MPDRQEAAILPGCSVGVLGSGQLGRMFAQAAARMGYRVHVFSPEANSPAGEVAFRQVVAPYDDADAVAEFARDVEVVTLEFENVPAIAAEAAARHAPVRPSGECLQIVQDRLREKRFLKAAGLPCTPFAPVTSDEELTTAVAEVGLPAVMKTAAWGYDGKGQAVVHTESDARHAWEAMDRQDAILEKLIDLRGEASVLAGRAVSGETATFGPIANRHVNHILDVSTYPAGELEPFAADAIEIARAAAAELNAVGLICVEFFVTQDNGLLINEIAPRPHNSGHLTIDACRVSQFEQQVRTICGLPPGPMELVPPAAAMANLLGDLWQFGEPNWSAALTDPRLSVHLYGKTDARVGRKMGHLTATAATIEEAEAAVLEGRAALASRK
ncbi:5-(carboxyamino)imidazole ribonucleotide synthase [Pirellulales bacterium]|nr:5-(carboxyamino)imidazole ribonucleotide synthase [Pirellulales bacterium]